VKLYRLKVDVFDRFFNYLNQVADHNREHKLFITSGRSFFSNIHGSIFTLLSENEAVDPFLIEFGAAYESSRSRSYFNRHRVERKTEFKQKLSTSRKPGEPRRGESRLRNLAMELEQRAEAILCANYEFS